LGVFVCPDEVELGPGRADGLVCLPSGVLGLVCTLLKAAGNQAPAERPSPSFLPSSARFGLPRALLVVGGLALPVLCGTVKFAPSSPPLGFTSLIMRGTAHSSSSPLRSSLPRCGQTQNPCPAVRGGDGVVDGPRVARGGCPPSHWRTGAAARRRLLLPRDEWCCWLVVFVCLDTGMWWMLLRLSQVFAFFLFGPASSSLSRRLVSWLLSLRPQSKVKSSNVGNT
jgi:hypothetical protein